MQNENKVSNKNAIIALILLIFFGVIGGHQFYAGKIAIGLLYLFTFGIFGIGVIIDFFMIISEKFKDNTGNNICF